MMLEIALEADEEWDSSRSWEPLVRKAVEAAIAESAYPDLARSGRPVEVSVQLTNDDHVRALNSKWRGKDKPTNVLSFPMAEEYELNDENVVEKELLLGDIIVGRGVCEREAVEKGVSLEQLGHFTAWLRQPGPTCRCLCRSKRSLWLRGFRQR